MAATNAVYNFWLYELCDVYIVRFRVRVLASWLTADVKSGSYETDDRPLRPRKNTHFSSTDTLHMSRPWSTAVTPFHAFRDGRVMAAALQAAK